MTSAAVILAGGRSSRMGRDKATLPWRGRRLVDIVADAAREGGAVEVYVSGPDLGYPAISDALACKGPVAGICASIQALFGTHRSAVFIPVDMPKLESGIIHALMQENSHEASHFQPPPLPCLLTLSERVRDYACGIHRRLEEGEECSVREFLKGLDAHAIFTPAAWERSLANTNTPQEWQEVTRESAY
ncbi:MAG: molybdenum cofactor guanylyltransferase [Alphaproteobacteria bacterium]|nr:molybdenum cofactor guanylyltransferase [Alphaproteobacteria bacterium]